MLLSGDFAELVTPEFKLERVGQHAVRGFSEPIELFAFHGEGKAAL